MDAQDFRSLQEAYMEVYQEQELDEELSDNTRRRAIRHIKDTKKLLKSMSREMDYDYNPEPEGYEPKSDKKIKKRTQKEQVDIYDIILSHLLDEEITPERRAQYKRGLKVRQSDQETVGKGRPRKRATSPQPGAQHYRKGMTQSHRDTMRDVAREENPERPEGSGSLPKGKKLERQKKTGVSAESYDIYDIILSHLLDEGYAETPEQAERIMVHMSEEWRESILG
jgi:hypothetical protein